MALAAPFPHDLAGTLALDFASTAAIPTDDPAIQFATGGREVSFVVPAGTLEARFGDSPQPGPIGFQTGTVAGTLTLRGCSRRAESKRRSGRRSTSAR